MPTMPAHDSWIQKRAGRTREGISESSCLRGCCPVMNENLDSEHDEGERQWFRIIHKSASAFTGLRDLDHVEILTATATTYEIAA